ncbi:MAG: TonB-dependent receptor [Pseudomonadota bacterium]
MPRFPKLHRSRSVVLAASSAVVLAIAAPASAQSAARQSVAIEAQALDTAIVEIGRRYGISVYAASELTSGKSARRVSGNLTAAEALSRVLAGTGLTYRRANDGRYIIARAAASRSSQPSNAAPAAAADTGPSPSDPILVIGTKRNKSIQQTYESVEVLTEDDLDKRAIYELRDILVRTPNVNPIFESLSNFSIRGIGSRGARATSVVGRTSNVYLDGAPLTAEGSVAAFNLWDVAQVEVLRGPQSTIQGRNALAGAVVVQTADPEYEFGARVRALVAEDNTYQGSAMLTGPIVADQIAFRVAVDYREQDFNTLNTATGGRLDDNEALTVRGKLLFEPEAISDLRLELGVNYNDSFSSGTNQRFVIPAFNSPEAEDFDVFDRVVFNPLGEGVEDNENVRLYADVQYDLSPEFKLVSLVTYDDTERLLGGVLGTSVRTDEVFAIDSRVEFDFGNVRGWVGGYYYDDSLSSQGNQEFDLNTLGITTDPPGGILTITTNRVIETENYAVYGDVTFDLAKNLSLNLAARYDWESSTDTGNDGSITANVDPCTATAPFLPQPRACTLLLPVSSGLVASADFDAFLPRASLAYSFDEDRSLAFTVARGYRAGGFNPGNDVIGEFDPEFLTNYELAFRSQWLDRRLTFNANIFFADYDDIQVALPTPLGLGVDIINAAEAEIYGAEFSLTYAVSPAIELFADLALLETEFVDFPFAVDDPVDRNPLPGEPGFANLAGNSFSNAPNTSATLGASYDDGSFFGSVTANYSEGAFSDFPNLESDRTDSYILTNARLGYRFGRARISIFAENLFNEEFIFFQNSQEVNVADGFVSLTPATVPDARISQQRAFGAEFEVSF